MRLPLLLLLILAAPALAAPPTAASTPHDPDLKIGEPCPDGPTVDALLGALPAYVKELVLLWPRAGCGDDGASSARLTLVNHQGEVLTLTVAVHARGTTPKALDYRSLPKEPIPRAELESVPSPDHPHILVRVAGQPATPREGLEGAGDFIDLPALVAAFDALL